PELAREEFKQVLAIEPDNEIALEKLREIETDKEVLDFYQFFQACNPAKTVDFSNSEKHKYYVKFSAVRSSLTEKLSRHIARSPNDPTCQLFTGHIGNGKSTELLRLKAELERQGFHVVYFQSSEDLDMADVDLTDILLAIARNVSQSVEEIRINLKPTGFNNLLQKVTELLTTQLELSGEAFLSGARVTAAVREISFSLSSNIGRITAPAKNAPHLRSQIRAYLGPLSSILIELINRELLEPAVEQLKQRGKQGLVVLVDNLDRISNLLGPTGRPQAEYLFVDCGEQLNKFNCHVVYTIPLTLIFSNDVIQLTNRFGVKPTLLPMIPVKFPDGRDCYEGLALLRQIVLARAFPEVDEIRRLDLITKIFDTPETLDRLCKISGGHLRAFW
ncbi:MAG: ATP-binding protein, partial [Okeania sp. SIO2H7]|nr:ATP-binding protein [Okeania sp. SIO2H7]